ALLPSLTRRISSALAMSPAASVSAFLHSIIGASVFSRNSLTMPAVISAIFLLHYLDVIINPCGGLHDVIKNTTSPYRAENSRDTTAPLALPLPAWSFKHPRNFHGQSCYLFGCSFFDFDELVFASQLLDEFIGRAALAFQNGIGQATSVQADGTAGVVVARNHVAHAFGRVVGVDHADDRDAQLAGFGDGDLVVADVDDED